ncbi:N-acetyltransferase family protein [Salana multivorans]
MTTADVSVRPALTSDLPALARVQLGSWAELLGEEAVGALAAEALAAQWGEAVADRDPRRRVLVALEGARLVGFAASSPTARSEEDDAEGGWTGELVALEVAAPFRRQGHGSRLLSAVVDLARDAGAHHVGAWTMTHDPARRSFLEAAGFAEAGLRLRLALPDGREAEEILLTAAI